MGLKRTIRNLRVALLLTGSAACVFACGGKHQQDEENLEGLMTQRAENLKMVEGTNGKLSYRFQAPLMETYEYDREPFREFRKGIIVETFSDSTNTVETTLIGDYAIHYIERSLWEVKGNVVATNANGQKLETQQLFWNQRTERIYSNVDSKLTQGNDVIIGVGFESDEQFVDWEFRRPRGTVEFDVEAVRGGEEDNGTDAEADDETVIDAGSVEAAVEAGIDAGGVEDALQEAAPQTPQREQADTRPARDNSRPSSNNGASSRRATESSSGAGGNTPAVSTDRVRSDRLRGNNTAAGRVESATENTRVEKVDRIPLTATPDAGQLMDVPLNRD